MTGWPSFGPVYVPPTNHPNYKGYAIGLVVALDLLLILFSILIAFLESLDWFYIDQFDLVRMVGKVHHYHRPAKLTQKQKAEFEKIKKLGEIEQ